DPGLRQRQSPAKRDVAVVLRLLAADVVLDLAELGQRSRCVVALPLDVGGERVGAHPAAEEALQQEGVVRAGVLVDRLLEPLAERALALLRDPVDLLVGPPLPGDSPRRRVAP